MTVLAFELAPLDALQHGFARALERESRTPGYPDWVRQMIILDFSHSLSPNDYFILDDHLRPSGHARVADRIARDRPPRLRAGSGSASGPAISGRDPAVAEVRALGLLPAAEDLIDGEESDLGVKVAGVSEPGPPCWRGR